MSYEGNIGTLFTKTYFSSYGSDENGKFQLKFKNLKAHYNILKNDVLLRNFSIPDSLGDEQFELTTVYPGLLIGSGYVHNVLGDDALKLGFFFDHTTGLPCIPGSSVKGVLRDACEKDEGNYILSIIEELKSGERKAVKDEIEIKNIALSFYEDVGKKQPLFMKKEIGKNGVEKIIPSEFVKKVFIGEGIPIYKRDIFFDAFPIHSFNDNGKFLANDYITHHEDPLKNPNPVQFLKVLPQVTFRFDFKLTDKGMDKDLKLELFKQILLDLGIGAKTNVGYGQFTNALKTDMNNSEKDIKSQHQKGNSSTKMQNIPFGVKLNKNEILDAKIIDIIGDYYRFGFNKDDNDCIVSKKEASVYKKFDENTKLEKGDKVIIKIQSDFLNSVDDLQFQVLPEGKSS